MLYEFAKFQKPLSNDLLRFPQRKTGCQSGQDIPIFFRNFHLIFIITNKPTLSSNILSLVTLFYNCTEERIVYNSEVTFHHIRVVWDNNNGIKMRMSLY